jgi:glycosyltransferase involved in cell wall biosynthesis
LGRKEYRMVPLYIDAFDVCWIPFASGSIAEHTNPMKLFEYFALGKPVVTTRLQEVEEFRQAGLVYCGHDEKSMTVAVRSALEERSEDKRLKRLAIAREHSWKSIVQKMKSIVVDGHD